MDSTRLAQIRKDFYLSTRSRVESISGKESPQLERYRKTYENELNRLKYSVLHRTHFINRLQQAGIVLVGDFHALKQSSRGLLRILRKMKSDIVLCLECICVEDQSYLDKFLTGLLTEKDFLNRIQWKKKWDFPWENYRPLFKWAQTHHIKVFGINTDAKQLSLKSRDQASAKVIRKIRSEFKKQQIFIQYGDLHLATKHLPQEIKKLVPKEDLCIVYQSPEIIYFKIMEDHRELSTDVVQLTEKQWALNVLPPWVKWQDYLLYLESGYDKKLKRSDHDLTDSVSYSVQLLSESFGLTTDTSSLSVYSSLDESFFDQLNVLPAALRRRIVESVQDGNSFYIPELETAFAGLCSTQPTSAAKFHR